MANRLCTECNAVQTGFANSPSGRSVLVTRGDFTYLEATQLDCSTTTRRASETQNGTGSAQGRWLRFVAAGFGCTCTSLTATAGLAGGRHYSAISFYLTAVAILIGAEVNVVIEEALGENKRTDYPGNSIMGGS
jgi:hypothetical protein